MINIEKLTQIINSHLETDEKIEAKIAGRTTVNNGAGEEIVDGLVGATQHHVWILINSFNNRVVRAFDFAQIKSFNFYEKSNEFYIGVSERLFVFSGVLNDPNPRELVQFIFRKKASSQTINNFSWTFNQR
ncbi:hypothetical protein HUU40_01275 [candidate division KSB1 bacterium]|nr:hypothetical protein [candidate division KSB1 bacterium]